MLFVNWMLRRLEIGGEQPLNGPGTGSRWASKIVDLLSEIRSQMAGASNRIKVMHEWLGPNSDGVQVWRSSRTITTLDQIEKNQRAIVDELRGLREDLRKR